MENKDADTEKREADAAGEREDQGLKPAQPDETGGPKGREPTRYGDWERKGRCIDF